MRKFRLRKDNYGYLFIMPFFILFFGLQIYPILYTLYLSFQQYDGISKAEFIGMANYTRLIKDPIFLKAVINTWRIWICNFIPQLIFGLGLAALLTQIRIRGRNFFRAVYYLPNLVTAASIGILFSVLLGRQNGTINQILLKLGIIKEQIYFLGSKGWSSTAVSAILWWMWFGHSMIIFMAGIRAIPDDLYEAARVDGAGEWQSFWKITLPLLRPIMVYVLVTSLIGGMQNFDIPYVIGEQMSLGTGEPQKVLLTIVMYLYNTAFRWSNRGYAAAIAYGLFLMIMVFSILIFIFMQRRETESRGVKNGKQR
ncbi:MAG: sugar ABC transporter permease [Actinomycetota bacterium]|nr:sugar ABC transporter permease [Actinomycetota bacterium]